MLIFINAFKSVTRSKGRNILIGIIVLSIAIASSVALAIRSAADTAKKSGLEAQTITGAISVDRQKLMENAQSGENGMDMEGMREMMQQYNGLTLSEQQEYANSDFIKDFYYTASTALNAGDKILAYGTTESEEEETEEPEINPEPPGQGQAMGGAGGGGHAFFLGAVPMGDFSVTGYSSESAMTKFVSGESQITDGEMFDIDSADLNCLISNELAAYNNLAVGDNITLANARDEEETYTLKIVGIYTDASSAEATGQMQFSSSMDPANLICMSFNAMNAMAAKSEENAVVETDDYGNETTTALTIQTSGTYAFATKEDYEEFDEELTSKGLSEYYVLSSADINSYESSLIPLENLNKFALTLLVIILSVGAVILVVLNIFNIRERKYEVGVLTAIGIKKAKVAAQFVVELMAVTLIAIVIGTGIGGIVSVPVANNLLESQIQVQESTQMSQERNFGRPGEGGMPTQIGRGGFGAVMFGGESFGSVEYLETINATININILLQLIGIGVLLTIFSSLVGIIFVLRYDPLKILANRT
jgi:ABC-type antimicrobial peptide transport system, permease component